MSDSLFSLRLSGFIFRSGNFLPDPYFFLIFRKRSSQRTTCLRSKPDIPFSQHIIPDHYDENLSLTLMCCLSLLNPYAQSVTKNLRGVVVEKGALELAIKQIVDTSRIVGLSVVIINDNKVVYNHAFGINNKETNALLNDTTIMYAASFTKNEP